MNREGNRFREKDGLRIESPAFVPDSLVQTELSGKELQAERLHTLLPKRSSELAERLWQITPELAPRVLASLSQGEEARGKSREALLKF